MTDLLREDVLKHAFEDDFQRYLGQSAIVAWRGRYIDHVARVRDADLSQWLTPDFQQRLWDDTSISGIGRGPIDVSGAFTDQDLARQLFEAREAGLPEDSDRRGAVLQALYDKVLERVHSRYADRRPRAKLARLVAAIFPGDMTCLLNGGSVLGVQRLIGATRAPGDFIAQNPGLRARLREVLRPT